MNQFPTFKDRLAHYESALDTLNSWIDITSQNRLYVYLQRLKEAIDRDDPIVDDHFVRLVFALQDIVEITQIIESYRAYPPERNDLKKLSELCDGSEHPDEENPQSRARSTQYELFLRANLQESGIKVEVGDEEAGEADLMIEMGHSRYPIEAKRPRREKRVDDKLRDATSKLRHQELPGIIALCLDRVIRPPHQHAGATTIEQIEEGMRDHFELFKHKNKHYIRSRVLEHAEEAVLANLYTFHTPALTESDRGNKIPGLNFLKHIDALISYDSPHFTLIEMLDATIISEVN